MRLSILVPAFKVEACIEACLRSLQNQDLPKSEYEIIVTNDGSPDNVKEIVMELQKEFPNIVLINQENQGVSMARNNALAVAKGNYILPVDPDDSVNENTLQRLLSKVEALDLDVLCLGFGIFDEQGKQLWQTNFSPLEDRCFTGVDAYFAARGFEVKFPDRSWGILYRKALLNTYEIGYPKDVPYLEDGLFLGKVFAVAKKVGFDNEMFYNLNIRVGSATNSSLFYSEKAMLGFVYAVENIKTFANQNKLEKDQILLVNHVVAKFVLLSLSPSMATYNFKEYFKIIKILKKANLDQLETNGLRFLYPKIIRAYNFSKVLFPLYFRLFNK